MNESSQQKLSTFYDEGNISPLVNLVKFLLMPFVFFGLLGFPVLSFLEGRGLTISTIISNYVNAISGFAGLAFFTLCGFFVLVPDRERRMRKITRALGRSFFTFVILFVCYLAINLFYFYYTGRMDQLLSPELLRLRTPFNFLVLNVWPLSVGGGIWFIQSLLYAYLFFFVVEKIKL